MHRRILFLIAVAGLSLALAGCGSRGDKAGARSAVEKTAKTAETPAPAAGGKVSLGTTNEIVARAIQAARGEGSFGSTQDAMDWVIESSGEALADGKEYFRRGRFEEALNKFSHAIFINPKFDSAYVYRGMALTMLNRPAEALPSFDKAIESAIKWRGADSEWLAWPRYQKGVVLLQLRQVNEGFAELDASIRLKPSAGALAARGNAYFVLGGLKRRSGDRQSARPYYLAAGADLDRAISMSGDSARLWSLKSSVHIMLDEKPQACKAARKACELGSCGMIEEFSECKEGGS